MERADVELKVREIVADVLGTSPGELSDGLAADSHDWESLQNLNIILAVEAAFERQFTPEQMETMHSVPRIVDVLVSRQ